MKSFKTFLIELSDDDLYDFADKVKAELNLSKFDLTRTPKGAILLRLLSTGKDNMSNGTGTKAMKMLCDYADKHRLQIVLTPSGKDERFGTTSKARLIEFYTRFGFVENKGKKENPTTTESMYRAPQ